MGIGLPRTLDKELVQLLRKLSRWDREYLREIADGYEEKAWLFINDAVREANKLGPIRRRRVKNAGIDGNDAINTAMFFLRLPTRVIARLVNNVTAAQLVQMVRNRTGGFSALTARDRDALLHMRRDWLLPALRSLYKQRLTASR